AVITGAITDDMNVAFDPVSVPFVSGGYNTTSDGKYTNLVTGVKYEASFNGGNYKISDITLGGSQKALIRGNVSIWAPNGVTINGNADIEIATGASLTIYSGGPV